MPHEPNDIDRSWTNDGSRFLLPLRIDTDAFVVTGTGVVLDANNECVAEYNTVAEAEGSWRRRTA